MIQFTEADVSQFPGQWSLNPQQMLVALNALDWSTIKHFNILEFGSGVGTTVLAELLLKKGIRFTYHSYEMAKKYVVQHHAVQGIYAPTFPAKLRPIEPHLVIIDGPNGSARTRWYPLVAQIAKPGCVVLVDDFDHYPVFARALNRNFKHEVIEHQNLGKPQHGAVICWKTVRIIE
jgi:hypothetical protein